MKEEADPDVVLTHDTGCVTTLDKSQFAAQAHGRNVGVPVMSEAQFAALAMGAHPYKVCQLHWHSADYRPLLEKMGIDWQAAWAEFEEDLKRLESGERKFLDLGGRGLAPARSTYGIAATTERGEDGCLRPSSVIGGGPAGLEAARGVAELGGSGRAGREGELPRRHADPGELRRAHAALRSRPRRPWAC